MATSTSVVGTRCGIAARLLAVAWGALLLCVGPLPASATTPLTPASGATPLTAIESVDAGTGNDSPILVALHGYGDTPRGFLRLVRKLVPGCRLFALQAPRRHPRRGFSWYRIGTASEQKDILESAERVAAFLTELRAKYPNTKAPLLFGYSQGAVVGLELARRFPTHTRGVLAIAGYLDTSPPARAANTANKPAILLVHGKADTVVPFRRALETRDALRRLNYEVSLVQHEQGHRISDEALDPIQRWLVHRLY